MSPWNSTRLLTIVIITLMTLLALVVLTSISSKVGEAAVGPAFLALGGLWTILAGSKIAEHATKHLRKDHND